MPADRRYWIVKTGLTQHHRLQMLSNNNVRWFYFCLLDLSAELDLNGCIALDNGLLFSRSALASRSNCRANRVQAYLNELVKVGLIEMDGEVPKISNYAKHQPELKSSTERVKRFRERKRNEESVSCNVSCNADETPCNAPSRSISRSKEEPPPTPLEKGGGISLSGDQKENPDTRNRGDPKPKTRSRRRLGRGKGNEDTRI